MHIEQYARIHCILRLNRYADTYALYSCPTVHAIEVEVATVGGRSLCACRGYECDECSLARMYPTDYKGERMKQPRMRDGEREVEEGREQRHVRHSRMLPMLLEIIE